MPPRRVVTGRSKEPRKRFAEELRLPRAQKGDSLRKLGEVLGRDASLSGKRESGKNPQGPALVFSATAWGFFVAAVKSRAV
ncbi:DUF397 domain-containing protein [Streptomyces kronopolitis]|uniref:DUF397 domain-containing protein n=1 Tax=Streptomyces kronopolitis TaxID=1612435 RepID=UPI003D962BA8